MEWMPIETAPRDGTQIIGYGVVRESAYIRDDEHPVGYWGKKDTDPMVRQTYFKANFWQTNGFGTMHPTHWQPLPPSPKA